MLTRLTILLLSISVYTLALVETVSAESDSAFEGTWLLEVPGTPYGDLTFTFEIIREEGSLKGNIYTDEGEATVQNIIERDNSIVVYWVAGEYDLDMNLSLTEEDTLSGWLVNTLRVTGTRVTD